MGLVSLREKISVKFRQHAFTEEDTLYLLVEIGKYIERSHPTKADLGDPIAAKVNPGDYKILRCFRNWVAHTEKNRDDLPPPIEARMRDLLDGAPPLLVETELFTLLKEEMDKFARALQINHLLPWEEFCHRLKCILSEQPMKIPSRKGKFVEFNINLTLAARK